MKNYYIIGGAFVPPTVLTSGIIRYDLEIDPLGDGNWEILDSIYNIVETPDHLLQFAFVLQTPLPLEASWLAGQPRVRIDPGTNTRGSISGIPALSQIGLEVIDRARREGVTAVALYDTHKWFSQDPTPMDQSLIDTISADVDAADGITCVNGNGVLTLDSIIVP
jgi:hypothetical protein